MNISNTQPALWKANQAVNEHGYPYFLTHPPQSFSATAEIIDTDFDSDSADEFFEGFPCNSVESLVTDSVTSISMPDGARTPSFYGPASPHFRTDSIPVIGPSGPHLFIFPNSSSDSKPQLDINLTSETTAAKTEVPLYIRAAKLSRERRGSPLYEGAPQPTYRALVANKPDALADESRVAYWAPEDVAVWMEKIGLDEDVVEKFLINDISGSILLELQMDDLKELGIQSFGIRRRLLDVIQGFRGSAIASSQAPVSGLAFHELESSPKRSTPRTGMADVSTDCLGSPTVCGPKYASKAGDRRHRRHHKRHDPCAITPGDSSSIVAIEQRLPSIHKCSKGESSCKWQKQQAKSARLVRDFSNGPVSSNGPRRIDGSESTVPVQLLEKARKPEASPSIIASSDVQEQNQAAEAYLSKEKLNVILPRDPQENVRNFLNFQRLSRLQPVNDPATPPRETFPSAQGDSPTPGRLSVNLSESLHHLPRLCIPNPHVSAAASARSLDYSAQCTVTPSILKAAAPFCGDSVHTSNDPAVGQSSGTLYKQGSHYGQSTPSSDLDVPVTAVPVTGIERGISLSVPPDMRFGSQDLMAAGQRQISDCPSTEVGDSCEHMRSRSKHCPQARQPDKHRHLQLNEVLMDNKNARRVGQYGSIPFDCGNDISHSGWMKKRKTTRFLRHEWEENHFALRGTRLAMYPDESSSNHDSKVLEYIDVDDYAVACSSLSSNSKLTAAFKNTLLRRKTNAVGGTGFAFSLIPAPGGGSIDRKLLLMGGLKSHHFAIKTADERINWMRELMLVRALKKAKDSGASISVNGSLI